MPTPTTPNAVTPLPPAVTAPSVPPLENGDEMTRDEFERRYAAMPHIKKAELIEGVVYMPSPVRAKSHSHPHADLIIVQGNYMDATPGVFLGIDSTIRLDMGNEPQPDAVLYIDPAKGGQCVWTDDYITNGPELISEISSTTVSRDLGQKFHVYRRNGVREYIVWRVGDLALDWFIRRGEQFDRLMAGADGIIRSEVFPGLWLDGAALVARDRVRVRQVLQMGLDSPEHAEFVKKLSGSK